jgi:hypothetical protein
MKTLNYGQKSAQCVLTLAIWKSEHFKIRKKFQPSKYETSRVFYLEPTKANIFQEDNQVRHHQLLTFLLDLWEG